MGGYGDYTPVCRRCLVRKERNDQYELELDWESNNGDEIVDGNGETNGEVYTV